VLQVALGMRACVQRASATDAASAQREGARLLGVGHVQRKGAEMLIKDDTADYPFPLLDDVEDGDKREDYYCVRGTTARLVIHREHQGVYDAEGKLVIEMDRRIRGMWLRKASDAHAIAEAIRAHAPTCGLSADPRAVTV
jgi:hypothetical protein